MTWEVLRWRPHPTGGCWYATALNRLEQADPGGFPHGPSALVTVVPT